MVEIFDNIRKLYTFGEACPDLAEHIEFFSESSIESAKKYIGNSNFSVRIFPSCTPTFYINLGSPYLIRGMRYSMYCSEKINYAGQTVIDKLEVMFPYFAVITGLNGTEKLGYIE